MLDEKFRRVLFTVSCVVCDPRPLYPFSSQAVLPYFEQLKFLLVSNWSQLIQFKHPQPLRCDVLPIYGKKSALGTVH